MGGLPARAFAIATSVAACVLVAGWSARAACEHWWPLTLPHTAGMALPGLRLDGVPLAAQSSLRSQVEARARGLQDRPVRLVVGDDAGVRVVAEATLGGLGVSVDVADVESRLLRIGRVEDVLTRARLAELARAGRLDVPLLPSLDPRIAAERLLPLKEDLDIAPVSARLDVERHSIVPEHDGRALDVDAAIAAISRLSSVLASAAGSTPASAGLAPEPVEVRLPFVAATPHVTSALISGIDVSHVLATFGTYFSRRGDQGPRAQNIEVAASHVDGLVVGPGELVSFNDLVGARSEDNGFQKAFEIYKGEMVEGTGGGTCQVASTLHAIAFFGGLDIVQRLPHSRPSAYIPVGLDATVVYPVVDLKLRNPYAFPVVVHATVGPNKLTMQLLGADKLVRVALMRTVLSTTPFERKVVEDPALAKPKRTQRGLDGMRLLRKRLIALRGGQSRVETSRDTYPPTTEIWKVPPGFDEGELPPLGEDFPNPDSPYGATPAPRADPEQTIWGG